MVVRSKTMRAKEAAWFIALFVANPAPVKAECGMEKHFKIYVQESYHANKVPAPMALCKSEEGPCTTSGTIFIVFTKEAKYAILLLDGIQGRLEVGKSYSAFSLCQKSPMMIPENKDGKPIAAFYVLEQRPQATEVQIRFDARSPMPNRVYRYSFGKS